MVRIVAGILGGAGTLFASVLRCWEHCDAHDRQQRDHVGFAADLCGAVPKLLYRGTGGRFRSGDYCELLGDGAVAASSQSGFSSRTELEGDRQGGGNSSFRGLLEHARWEPGGARGE